MYNANSLNILSHVVIIVQVFHLDEFIPLFIFIWTISALYGALAPVTGVFVAGFFFLASKVFTFMALYVYSNNYEAGGFLHYTLSNILFAVLYLVILIVAGTISAHGSNAMASVFLFPLLAITLTVQRLVYKTFVEPSLTLSLTRAREFDENSDRRTPYERKLQLVMDAKKEFEDLQEKNDFDSGHRDKILSTFAEHAEKNTFGGNEDATLVSEEDGHLPGDAKPGESSPPESERRRKAAARMQRRYHEGVDSLSDVTDSEWSDSTTPTLDYFVYRQPSLNRAMWESSPRPYRECVRQLRSSRRTLDGGANGDFAEERMDV